MLGFSEVINDNVFDLVEDMVGMPMSSSSNDSFPHKYVVEGVVMGSRSILRLCYLPIKTMLESW